MNQTPLGTFDHIALDAIRPSPTNPRKNYDPVKLEELAASIREMGVTQPILVRPRFSMSQQGEIRDYEIVAGERRWRAAKMAGRTDIPAIVREMDDDEARDLQLVENLQRADLHPVEEAEGYRALQAAGATAEEIAKKAGKTAAYVQQRLKLLTLELPAKTLFHAGHLNLGHALVLARLTPADQDKALRELLKANHLPKKEDMVKYVERRIKDRYGDHPIVTMTQGELYKWVQSHVMLSLAKVPWSLDDATLVPEAGACTDCPKRTGTNAALFADITTDESTCLDAACFDTKRKASVLVTIKASADAGETMVKLSAKTGNKPIEGDLSPKAKLLHGQWVVAKAKSCRDTIKGILVDEPGTYSELRGKFKAGQVITICAFQKCTVHKHQVDGQKGSGHNGAGAARGHTDKQREEYVKAETPIREAIINTILNEAEPGMLEIRSAIFAQCKEYAAIARELGREVQSRSTAWQAEQEAKPAVEKYLETANIELLARVVLIDALHWNTMPSSWMSERVKDDRERLWKLAEQYGVDADAIAKTFEAPKPAAAVPAKTPAKKVAAKKKISAAEQTKRKAAAAKVHAPKPKKLSAEARKSIAENMKKRWAAAQTKRATAQKAVK